MTHEIKIKTLTVALTGNPNSGKTTIFNKLANARESVGNYPRVTITPRERLIEHRGRQIMLVDLPGIYSLSARTPEEQAGRDYIHFKRPDVVINILDSGSLDRSLFLTTQLIEMGCHRIHALNMFDEATSKGISIDSQALVSMLGGPVIETVATTGEGLERLLDAAIEIADPTKPRYPNVSIGYDAHLEAAIERVRASITALHPSEMSASQSRWLAIKLLEGDDEILTREGEHKELIEQVKTERVTFKQHHDESCEHAFAAGRYGFIHGLLMEARTVSAKVNDEVMRHAKIDDILLHRWLGLPILLGLMWVMFQTTFTVGAYPTDAIKAAVESLSTVLNGALPDSMIKDLMLKGVLAGVGGTIVFLPNVVFLFFFLALFSETGYIARGAFLLDRLMHTFGLHGKALIPLIMGYGCNAPAIMATRTIEGERSRIITSLVTPFMCCSARLPVMMLFAGAFFSAQAGTMVFLMYILSIVTALGSAVLLSKTVLRSMPEPFVMELPPYRMPSLRAVLFHMWENASAFLQKVGSVILVGSIVIWFLQEFPRNIEYSQDYEAALSELASQPASEQRTLAEKELNAEHERERLEKSYLGRIGIAVSPVFEPMGFGWKDTVAILTGVVAKEAVVASYAVLYAQSKESEGLMTSISVSMTPVQAFAFMVFTLLYLPCLATIGAIRREAGSWKWVGFSVVYSLSLAWALALIIINVGRVLL